MGTDTVDTPEMAMWRQGRALSDAALLLTRLADAADRLEEHAKRCEERLAVTNALLTRLVELAGASLALNPSPLSSLLLQRQAPPPSPAESSSDAVSLALGEMLAERIGANRIT